MSGQEHESFIKTPGQLIWIVALGFIVPVVVALLLAIFVTSGKRTGAGSAAMTPEAIEARIRPVAGFELKGAGGPKVLASGADVYKVQCAACHDAGAAGAPKLGDAAAWAARIRTGYETLLNSALKGKGAMAAQGGGQYDDVEIARAVVHLVNASGAKFAEPKAPASGEAKADDKAAAPAAAGTGAK